MIISAFHPACFVCKRKTGTAHAILELDSIKTMLHIFKLFPRSTTGTVCTQGKLVRVTVHACNHHLKALRELCTLIPEQKLSLELVEQVRTHGMRDLN